MGEGAGYYASFHPLKYQVPPEGDRIGEMKKDLAAMREIGFNFVRTSALGDVRWNEAEQKVEMSLPFADETVAEAEKQDLAVLIRLQNYSMALRQDPEDAKTVDENGTPLGSIYSAFLPHCVNHPGVIADNEIATEAVAKHFSAYPSVVAHLMYNEPAYPYSGFHDYHPESIKAYRRWVVEKGYMTEEQAKDYDPPRKRPISSEGDREWAWWRMFSTEQLSRFLCDMGKWSDKGSPKTESMTCTMPVMLQASGVKLGEDIFAMGDGMDVIGITTYLPNVGQPIWYTMLYLDTLGSASRMNGKHVWAAECNAHISLSQEEWQRETYNLLGSGFKGLIYYQWRADYDNGKGPEIGLFGILHNDRTPSDKYPIVKPCNEMVASVAEELATADRFPSQIGILFSQYAYAVCDAAYERAYTAGQIVANNKRYIPGNFKGYNTVTSQYNRAAVNLEDVHRDLRQKQIIPQIVRASDLEKNPLGVRAVLVPNPECISDEEVEMLRKFALAGGYVFLYQPAERNNGYLLMPESPEIPIHPYCNWWGTKQTLSVEDILVGCKIDRPVRVSCGIDTLTFNILENEKHLIVTLVNYDNFERPIYDAVLTVDKNLVGTAARFRTVTRDLQITDETVGDKVRFTLPEVCTGAFVIIDKAENK